MYPYLRSFYCIWRAFRMRPLDLFDTHVSHHRIWPLDIDPWMELNNGRTLTLYDLGRLPLFARMGLLKATRKSGMFFTVAGASVRYRARIRPLDKVEMRSRVIGFDDRFTYIDQSLWLGETCANQVLIRTAVARRGKGIVSPGQALREMGFEAQSPELPDWVKNWIAAEATRTWPPENT